MNINPRKEIDKDHNKNFDVGLDEENPVWNSIPIVPESENNLTSETQYMSGDATPSGREGGTLPFQEHTHEETPEQNNHSGNGGISNEIGAVAEGCEGDDLVDVEIIVKRFRTLTRKAIPKDSSQRGYEGAFRRFSQMMELPKYTKKQLKTKKGRNLLLAYLYDHVNEKSRPVRRSQLEAYWKYGLGLPWPLDNKIDFGRERAPVKPIETPPDYKVKKWIEAVRHEPDKYLKLLVLIIMEHGWRPEQTGKIKWRNIRYDQDGRPCHFIADGGVEGFKTGSWIIAWLCPEVRVALEAWRSGYKELLGLGLQDGIPEHYPILPVRYKDGEIDTADSIDKQHIRRWWMRFAEKWDLPYIKPKEFRHWVKKKCKEHKVPRQARDALMGHQIVIKNDMDDRYGQPFADELIETQSEYLPEGAIGLLEPNVQLIESSLPKDIIAKIHQYYNDQIGLMELLSALEKSKQIHPSNGILISN